MVAPVAHASPVSPGLVLFDLDNTLVDRQSAFRSWAESFVADRDLGPEAVDWLCTADDDGFATRDDVFVRARRQFGLGDSVEDLIAQYRRGYFEFFRPDPSVIEPLELLRASGWRIGIVTNGPATQRRKIEQTGLATRVDGVCISDELGMEKPDRRIFEIAVSRCGVAGTARDRVWMVGDSPKADIAGGKGAGLRTAWLHRGRAWSAPDPRPDLVVAHVAQVVAHVVEHVVAHVVEHVEE